MNDARIASRCSPSHAALPIRDQTKSRWPVALCAAIRSSLVPPKVIKASAPRTSNVSNRRVWHSYTIDANRSLTFTLHEVYLALAKTPVEGPGGVEASFEFRAAFNAAATRMMTAVLNNQQAGTEYA